MDSEVYMNDGFVRLLSLLAKLQVINLRSHKVSHAYTLVGGHFVYRASPDWIKVSSGGFHDVYIEIIGRCDGRSIDKEGFGFL